jgi:hypothetical protein
VFCERSLDELLLRVSNSSLLWVSEKQSHITGSAITSCVKENRLSKMEGKRRKTQKIIIPMKKLYTSRGLPCTDEEMIVWRERDD